MRRLRLSKKGKRFFGSVGAGLLAIIVIICSCCIKCGSHHEVLETVEETWDPMDYLVRYNHLQLNYARTFNDLNPVHLEAAKKIGLSSIPDKRDVVDLSKLVLVEDCDSYCIDELTYSIPYLTRKAKEELDRIGAAFSKKLSDEGLPPYKFVVTSILRTQEDVKNLRKVNVNASANSAHCYGTTWDISYFTFEKADDSREWLYPDDLKVALGEVLREEQKAGRLYVKYEKQESCFHMTAR